MKPLPTLVKATKKMYCLAYYLRTATFPPMVATIYNVLPKPLRYFADGFICNLGNCRIVCVVILASRISRCVCILKILNSIFSSRTCCTLWTGQVPSTYIISCPCRGRSGFGTKTASRLMGCFQAPCCSLGQLALPSLSKKVRIRRQWKPLPTLIKEKEDVHIIIVECVDGLCGCHWKSLILLVSPEFLLNMRGVQGGQV